MLITGSMPKTTIDRLSKESQEFQFSSGYKFLQEHRGFRRGKVHTVLGTPGGGKSTLVKSIIIDFLQQNQNEKLLVYLSEETRKEFAIEMHRTLGNIANDYLDRCVVIEECGLPAHVIKNADGLIEYLKKTMALSDFSGVLFDNLTTSRFYQGKRPGEQGDIAMSIKHLTQDNNVFMLLICHTRSEVHDNSERLIHENDIRGSKTLVNLTEFLYILQRMVVNETIYPFLFIKKNRSQNEVNHRQYSLVFDHEKSFYGEDRHVDFSDVKQIWQDRNKLTGGK